MRRNRIEPLVASNPAEGPVGPVAREASFSEFAGLVRKQTHRAETGVADSWEFSPASESSDESFGASGPLHSGDFEGAVLGALGRAQQRESAATRHHLEVCPGSSGHQQDAMPG